MTAQERVEDLLAHYLRTVWQAAGLTWDSDNYAEVGNIVDGIADMIRARVEHHEDTRHADPTPTPSTVGATPEPEHITQIIQLANRYGWACTCGETSTGPYATQRGVAEYDAREHVRRATSTKDGES